LGNKNELQYRRQIEKDLNNKINRVVDTLINSKKEHKSKKLKKLLKNRKHVDYRTKES
jgi:hypothetical protein